MRKANDPPLSRLRMAETGEAYGATLLARARDKTDDLQTNMVCVVCWAKRTQTQVHGTAALRTLLCVP